MKFFALSSLAALSLLAGCAASTSESVADGQDDITASTKIELSSVADEASIQAKLYNLLDAFKGEADLGIAKDVATLSMKGAREDGAPARSISCNESKLVHATLGQGVSTTSFFACTLAGFQTVRNGGQLPSVVLKDDASQPLAGKLFSLLLKGEQKGGLGVVKTSGDSHPPCCDMPISTTFAISDSTSTLSCTERAGGFAFIRSVECTLSKNDANEVEVQKGTLVHTVGIGGENTGFSAKIGNNVVELVLGTPDMKQFVEGRVARITGSLTTLSGIETHDRPAIKVTNLLVCPAAHTTLNMMPPVSDDTLWISENCPDLGDVVQ
jgi:hypothetical protein